MLILQPHTLGELELPNRLVMAPMTRNRATGCVAQPIMATYYAQRAGAGLIVSEGTQISALGQGYQDTPGIYTEEQRDAWRMVTDAVHAAGGRIFAQLWHCGRVSHSYYHGQLPVAPSGIAPPGKAYTPAGMVPYETPRALSTDEVHEVVDQFRHAARVARDAGFDGVEIHGANGYLVDQFLQSGSNARTDEYGGSVERRARFLLEVVDAAQSVWGAGRVGVRLSPGGTNNGVHDDDPVATFGYAARALESLGGLAYLHVVEAPVGTSGPDDRAVCATELVRPLFGGTLITTGGYSPESGERALDKGCADLVGFGRLFIANPDLPERVRTGAELAEPDRATFYGGGEHGYTDYPALSAVG